jgi:uncharacterized membrane protein YfcA
MIDLFVFITALVATMLSSMSGGGSSIIAIPVLLSLGVSFPVATAAMDICAMFWVVVAAYNYLHGKKINWRFLIIYALLGLLGVWLGVFAVLNISQRILNLTVGTIILVLVIYTYFRKPNQSASKAEIKKWDLWAYITAPFVGFYETFFGSGNGIIFSTITHKAKGFDFMTSLGYYYAIACPWCAISAILLIQKGCWNTHIDIAVVLGSLIGSYVGSKYARYKGNAFIKLAFVIIGGVLGLKMLLGL